MVTMRSLFSREAVRELRKDRFSGNLMVRWENGVINDIEIDRDFLASDLE
jgi:hypothetical protein